MTTLTIFYFVAALVAIFWIAFLVWFFRREREYEHVFELSAEQPDKDMLRFGTARTVPKPAKPAHVRHQGAREKTRRLKRESPDRIILSPAQKKAYKELRKALNLPPYHITDTTFEGASVQPMEEVLIMKENTDSLAFVVDGNVTSLSDVSPAPENAATSLQTQNTGISAEGYDGNSGGMDFGWSRSETAPPRLSLLLSLHIQIVTMEKARFLRLTVGEVVRATEPETISDRKAQAQHLGFLLSTDY